MTVGRNQYNEADLLQMQRDAEARVRDMQKKARQTLEDANNGSFQPHYRGWSQNPGMRRQQPGMNGRRPGQPQRQQNRPPDDHEANSDRQQANAPPPEPPPAPKPPATEPEKKGTIIGDIMAALGLDEDYLLIIGLILILVNQRADTTLILALAYLLI